MNSTRWRAVWLLVAFVFCLATANCASAAWWCAMCGTWHGTGPRTQQMRRQPVITGWPATPAQPVAPAFAATPPEVVAAIIEHAALTPEDVVYDLGCGDGRILRAAYERWGCRGVGIEQNRQIAELARGNCRGLPVRIVTGDARRFLYSRPTVVYLYLYPEMIRELLPKLKAVPLIISYMHPIPGYPSARVVFEGKYPVYFLDRRPKVPISITPWQFLRRSNR